MTGIAIYNDANDNSADAYIAEKATFDTCLGHVSPNPAGMYHYHAVPGLASKPGSCVYNDTSGKHSPLFAIMIDGIPLYGAYGDNGVVPTDLVGPASVTLLLHAVAITVDIWTLEILN